MNTTGLVTTVTDELIEELECASKTYGGMQVDRSKAAYILDEFRRLRAENAELARVVKDVRWRVADTTDQLQAYGHNGDRLYGLDEWSVPIRNLNIAIGILEKATQ